MKRLLLFVIFSFEWCFLNASACIHPSFEVELVFNQPNTPLIPTQIGDLRILQLLDLGAALECGLNKEILAKIDKEVFGKCAYRTSDGVITEEVQFIIPELKIGSLTVNHVVVNEKANEINGMIGNKILEKYNLLLDFPAKKVTFVQDIFHTMIGWIKVPFEWQSVGMIINVETDLGVKKYLLDTGATHNFIYDKEPSEKTIPNQIVSSKFILGGYDFGEQILTKLRDPLPFANEQGAVGMEFLKHHVIFIDYPNKALYIKKDRND